jgi:hypothetical protein
VYNKGTNKENEVQTMKKKLKKNKLMGIVLLFVAALSVLISKDITACVFISLISVPLFLAKRNYINF